MGRWLLLVALLVGCDNACTESSIDACHWACEGRGVQRATGAECVCVPPPAPLSVMGYPLTHPGVDGGAVR